MKAYAASHRVERRKYSREYWRMQKGLPKPTRPEPALCECCGKASKRPICLDHDHLTGAFRGWLCNNCNNGLGKIGDSVESVQRMLYYLTVIAGGN